MANQRLQNRNVVATFNYVGVDNATLAAQIAARELRVATGTPTMVVNWGDLETEEIDALQEQLAGGHGDEIETSIHLVLQPELVHMDRATVDYRGAGGARGVARDGGGRRDPA